MTCSFNALSQLQTYHNFVYEVVEWQLTALVTTDNLGIPSREAPTVFFFDADSYSCTLNVETYPRHVSAHESNNLYIVLLTGLLRLFYKYSTFHPP